MYSQSRHHFLFCYCVTHPVVSYWSIVASLSPIGCGTCQSPRVLWLLRTHPARVTAFPASQTWRRNPGDTSRETAPTAAMKIANVAAYGLALVLLAVGLRELLTGFEENRCSMTYMFEYPEYRVRSRANISSSAPFPKIRFACFFPEAPSVFC